MTMDFNSQCINQTSFCVDTEILLVPPHAPMCCSRSCEDKKNIPNEDLYEEDARKKRTSGSYDKTWKIDGTYIEKGNNDIIKQEIGYTTRRKRSKGRPMYTWTLQIHKEHTERR
ncbi:hypothetical protein CBL_05115 [Carabus blaptoides fortunei]